MNQELPKKLAPQSYRIPSFDIAASEPEIQLWQNDVFDAFLEFEKTLTLEKCQNYINHLKKRWMVEPLNLPKFTIIYEEFMFNLYLNFTMSHVKTSVTYTVCVKVMLYLILIMNPNYFGAKTKIMCINTKLDTPITIDDTQIERVSEFTHIGSIISTAMRTHRGIKNILAKAKIAFARLRPAWKSTSNSNETKLKLYHSVVKAKLMCRSGCWEKCESGRKSMNTFQFGSLPIKIPKRVLQWTPQGRRKVGRPAVTWRSKSTKRFYEIGMTWGEGWQTYPTKSLPTNHDPTMPFPTK
ncbi:endonuclease-reverse transcriptase [Brachionus plicatilis]|uniref:Endonuclease-reverse transcriptase n=1 Tax=Brachionus plicatilis TaxID=10195 RepID=A0A3M7RNA6_BRAPC|nr:endonuclease-reverse transcriptase [Brachionus plicatilis]